jgi:cysteine synthase
MHVAVEKAKKLGNGKVIVVILPDLGERYLSMTNYSKTNKNTDKP